VTFSASGAAYGSKDVGDYTLTITGISLSGTDAGNYTLSSTSATSHGTISPRPATVTPTVDQGKVYGVQSRRRRFDISKLVEAIR
jgi:hypothetical protein